MYKEIDGDLIELALAGSFDVIAHGCNCFNLQGAGIAKQMKNTFDTKSYSLEDPSYKGDINKLGQIDYEYVVSDIDTELIVVNAYTQYQPGANLDYEALTLCLRKINHIFKGKRIGLPQIGAGIAGGVWDINKYAIENKDQFRAHVKLKQNNFKDVKTIIQQELKDCNVTVVIYNK